MMLSSVNSSTSSSTSITHPAASTIAERPSCCKRLFECVKKVFRWIAFIFTCGYCCRSRNFTATTTATSSILVIDPNLTETRMRNAMRYEVSGDEVQIDVFPRHVLSNPKLHLERLADVLRQNSTILTTRIKYYDEARAGQGNLFQEGTDAGGLSRDYFNRLMGALFVADGQTMIASGPYVMPCSRARYIQGSNQLPQLTDEERRFFRDLGLCIKFCSTSTRGLSLGERCPLAFYEACLTEFDSSLTNDQRRLSMIRILIDKDTTSSNAAKESDLQMWAAADVGAVNPRHKANFIAILAENDNITDEGLLQAIKNNLYDRYAHYASAIEAIREGLGSVSQSDPAAFMRRVQGEVTPQRLAAAIECNNQRIEHKREWLKDWILGRNGCVQATREEMLTFLQFVTGQRALAQGGTIGLDVLDRAGLPVAHTCFNRLDVSYARVGTDRRPFETTREEFIDHVKTAMNNTAHAGFAIA